MSQLCSVVIPVFNEQEGLRRLYEQLARVAAQVPEMSWEFVLVDDGSTDDSWDALCQLHAQDARVRPIRLARNFGQTPAMVCGIDRARGAVIVTMDGDLQNDPADIPRLLEKVHEGYDVVCGWRFKRQDKWWTRKVPSMIANRLIGLMTGVRLHDAGCSLKAYRASAIKRVPLYAEFHRFIPALSTLTGALVTEVKVNHRPRQFGKTKYTLSRTWRVALDMVTVSLLVKFASKPLRFFGGLAVGALVVAVVCVVRALHGVYADPALMMSLVLPGIAAVALWLAGHLAGVGLIAELVLASAHATPEEFVAATEMSRS